MQRMISLLIAGGVYVATSSTTTVQWPDVDNHTLRGEVIASSMVVCRNRWGTPMLPDGTGGYSLISPINQDWINQSLIIPPRNSDMVAYRPLPVLQERVEVTGTPVVPAPSVN